MNIEQFRKKITEIRDLIQVEIYNIMKQLDGARTKLISTGEHSNSDWYGKANYQLRSKRHQVQILNRKIKELKTLEVREYTNQLRGKFIEVAKRRLDNELYSSILEEAKDIVAYNGRDLKGRVENLFTPIEMNYLQNEYGDIFEK